MASSSLVHSTMVVRCPRCVSEWQQAMPETEPEPDTEPERKAYEPPAVVKTEPAPDEPAPDEPAPDEPAPDELPTPDERPKKKRSAKKKR